ncbi:MAG: alpha-amylase family glycosyl hydrolase [Nonlabens sp.]
MSKKLFQYILILSTIIIFSCEGDESNASQQTDPIDSVDPIDPTDPNDPPADYQQYGTPFNAVPETSDVIMYEVNLRAFSNSGTIQGVINKLDHIEQLGINTIWLMPIYPQGMLRSVGSPYAVRNYKEVGNEYGDLAALRRLTDAAHARGMTVILDWVANHTAWDNPWINEHPEWYTKDSAGRIIHPAGTNWQDVADLNFDVQEMRDAMIDAMRYWVLEANVDGFRCDYADGVPADFWEEATDELSAIPNRDLIFFAEGNRPDHLTSGFDMAFGWEFYGGIKEAFEGAAAGNAFAKAQSEYSNVPTGKEMVRFTTNHDFSAWEATPIMVFNGVDGALGASVAAIFHDGVPMIYSSQEVGQASTVPFFSNATINWSQNQNMLNQYRTMLQFYANSPAARKGSNTEYTHPDVIHFKKTLNGDEVSIIVNTRNRNVTYSLPSEIQNTTWTDVMTSTSINLGTQLQLGAYEYLILD